MHQLFSVPAVLATLAIAGAVTAQSDQRTAFVTNNGNLQGSVTSYTFDEAGNPTLVDFLITGQKQSSAEFHPGTNAYAVDISPNGEFLAVTHATGNPPPGFPAGRRITMVRVNADATMAIHGTFQVPSTPMDVVWLDDEFVAVTESSAGGLNRIWVYRFDWETNELIMRDAKIRGVFSTSVALSPDRSHLYVNDSFGGNNISVFEINPNFTLTLVQTQSTGSVYPLGLGMSPNGRWLSFGGGISSGGKAVMGYDIDANDATLTLIAGSPFQSPGSSPKQVVFSSDSAFAFAGHGTDATVRSFAVDQSTGQFTPTGFFMDAGGQGSLGNIAVLDELLLVADRDTFTDGVQGLHCFTINADGSLSQNGPAIPTQGIAANDIAVWPMEPCPADLTGSGDVGVSDLLAMLGAWGQCSGTCPADLSGDGVVNVIDMLLLLAAWGSCD